MAQAGIAPERNWFKAAVLGDGVAAQALIEKASATKQLHWLTLLAEMNIANAQYQLAKLTDNKSLRSVMLQRAASQDHLEALFEIGQTSYDSGSKVSAFSRAASLNHKPSQFALYQWYWLEEEYEQALPWLALYAEQHGESALILARYLWKNQRFEEAKNWFLKAHQLGEKGARLYQNLIRDYWRKPVKVAQSQVPSSLENCSMQLQFLATNLESMRQAVEFRSRYNKDKRLDSLPICINEPIWVNSKQLTCHHHAINKNRITCEVGKLANYFQPGDFTHLVVFTEQGKANVNNGIMYLDLADQYSVFVHELAHFAGFVDEYPVSEKLAEHVCNPQQVHPNILVQAPVAQEEATEEVLQEITEGIKEAKVEQKPLDLSYWQQFGESLALSKSRTCNNHPNQSYKLSSRLTFMEFHDQQHIPPLYLKIWKDRLNAPEHLVPASLNIAHALEDEGDFSQAEVWRRHFVQYRRGGVTNMEIGH